MQTCWWPLSDHWSVQAHLTSLVWVCVLWLPWKLNGAICAMKASYVNGGHSCDHCGTLWFVQKFTSISNHQIPANFCTCRDSTADMTYAKFCRDHGTRIWLEQNEIELLVKIILYEEMDCQSLNISTKRLHMSMEGTAVTDVGHRDLYYILNEENKWLCGYIILLNP